MAHPYAGYSANKVAQRTAQQRVKGYDSGGSVTALHPGGTFARNADKTDTHATLRKALGMPDPPSASIIPLAPRPKPTKAAGGAVTGYARGGKIKKPSIEINIISPPSQGGPSSSTLPVLPPAPGPSAPMLPPGGGPIPPGGPPMPPPGMKRGGRVKMTGGAEGGMGRIQKAKATKAARGG